MLKISRYELILKLINEKKNIRIEELLKEIDVSEATIRRDLNFLEEIGKVKRVHGGAISIETEEDWLLYRKEVNSEEKEKIAKYSASLVNNGDTIYLDAGSTVTNIIKYLYKKDKIKVITNSIENIQELHKYKIESYLIGGKMKILTGSLVGSTAVLSIKNFNFDLAFMGTNGIDENGYSTPDAEEALIKNEALKIAKESYFLCDYSKFNKSYLINFAKLEDSNLITNNIDISKDIKNKVKSLYITK